MANIFDKVAVDLKENKDTLTTVSESDTAAINDVFPTLIPLYDKGLVGGIPARGRFTEIYGEPSTGKSTFASTIAGIAQHMNAFIVLFDIEGTTSADRLEELGANSTQVMSFKPKIDKKTKAILPITIEDVGNAVIERCTKARLEYGEDVIPFFIWDSVAQSQSNKQAGMNPDDQEQPAMQAKALTSFVRHATPNLVAANAVFIALNQARADMNGNSFLGPQVTTVGGNAWQHAMSSRIFMKRGSKLKASSTDNTEIGHIVKLQLKKSKVAGNAGQQVEGSLYLNGGFSLGRNLFAEAKDLGIIGGSAQFPTFVTENGEEIKKRTKEWEDFLESYEGEEVLGDLWRRVVKVDFPELYPALFNIHAIMDEEDFPMIAGMRDYYINIQEQLPENRQHIMYRNWKRAQ